MQLVEPYVNVMFGSGTLRLDVDGSQGATVKRETQKSQQLRWLLCAERKLGGGGLNSTRAASD